jgi:hypothetical protein
MTRPSIGNVTTCNRNDTGRLSIGQTFYSGANRTSAGSPPVDVAMSRVRIEAVVRPAKLLTPTGQTEPKRCSVTVFSCSIAVRIAFASRSGLWFFLGFDRLCVAPARPVEAALLPICPVPGRSPHTTVLNLANVVFVAPQSLSILTIS